jgi:3D (Asp-Asp-Asp) domain-containing protein
MKSTALGSAVSVLLAFSAISYAKNYVQDPKPVQTVRTSTQETGSQPVNPETRVSGPVIANPSTSSGIEKTSPSVSNNDFEVAPQTYTATAYSLRGRTASGKPVSRGLIAADPRILPLGTRVRVEAGAFSGEYLVADTGGAVKGRRIDIWTPTAREAMRFGRRAVKLTVLSFGGKRSKSAAVRPRQVNPSTAPATQSTDK